MIAILLGYLAGSVPFAFLLARRRGIDVRRAGSGNVGAANVLRTTGTGRAVAVMALDVAKGAAAVALAHLDAAAARRSSRPPAQRRSSGTSIPVWLRFHGGKGVAVAAGVFTVLAPIATAVAAALFVLTVWADPLRVAGIDRRDGGAAAGGMAGRRARRGRRRGRRSGGADPVSPSRQPPSAARRHRTADVAAQRLAADVAR